MWKTIFGVATIVIGLGTTTIPAEAKDSAEITCLARAIYFEARDQKEYGMKLVAFVIINRRNEPNFPSTICGVVYQRGKNGCAFSFVCEKHLTIKEQDAWEEAKFVAFLLYFYHDRMYDPTRGATYFHSRKVRPSWRTQLRRTLETDEHIFYADR